MDAARMAARAREYIESSPHLYDNMKSFGANKYYYYQNRENLQKNYGGKFVIISNEDVIASASNFEEFSRELSKLDDKQRTIAFITHVPRMNELIMV
ncbi:MAG: DUF5678 domain-containing protein [Methanotrichaceae archaeon]|nr:DUF5678 domain-containing protein [Methanotrichaceae archaeon]